MNIFNKRKSLLSWVLVFGIAPLGSALELNGSVVDGGSTLTHGSAAWLQKTKELGLVGLYMFNETSGPVRDVSGYRNTNNNLEPLDLVIDDPISGVQEVIRKNGSLEIRFPTLIHSNGPATKIYRECSASSELTVEAWLKNASTAELPRVNPIRIVTMSNKIDPSASGPSERQRLSSVNRNFFLGQEYEDSSRYKGVVRTSNSPRGRAPASVPTGGEIGIGPNITKVGEMQHVIMTRSKDGVSRFYVSYEDDSGNIIDTLRTEIANSNALRGSFNNWDPSAILGIGNEISYNDPDARKIDLGDGEESRNTSEDRAWLGELYLVAVYCKALEPSDINGAAAAASDTYQKFQLNPNMVVTPNHSKAMLLYKRLVGVGTSISNPVIDQMASEIAGGGNGLLRAAEIASEERDFYNITVKDFAGRMSTRDETVSAPLSDFSATIIGVTRDEISAQQLLTGNFYYRADPTKAAVVGNSFEDIVSSNRHYDALTSGRFDLKRVLVKKSPQLISNGQNGVVANPNPAGLLTTRAFMQAHAVAGTNRRLVEFTFREFLCSPMEKWADAYGPDNYVGRDVERFPGGVHSKYTSTCRACHSGMDSLRGAFSRFTFSNNVIKNAYIVGMGNLNAAEEDPDSMKQNPSGVASKMNHNDDKYPPGHVIGDDFFENVAIRGANALRFGWSGPLKGYGVKEYGEMISKSKAFPKCFSDRVYRSLCKREPASFDQPMLEKAAEDFVSDNYNIKKLFQRISITPECLGK